MPALIAANIDTKDLVVSWVDWSGKKSTSSLRDMPNASTEAQAIAIVNASGAISNAAVYKQSYHSDSESAIDAVTAYDDAVSEVSTGVNIVYQNTVTLATKVFRVPAPHRSHLTTDGKFLLPRTTDAAVETLLAAIETALGASWVFSTAAVSTHKKGTAEASVTPIVTEPP